MINHALSAATRKRRASGAFFMSSVSLPPRFSDNLPKETIRHRFGNAGTPVSLHALRNKKAFNAEWAPLFPKTSTSSVRSPERLSFRGRACFPTFSKRLFRRRARTLTPPEKVPTSTSGLFYYFSWVMRITPIELQGFRRPSRPLNEHSANELRTVCTVISTDSSHGQHPCSFPKNSPVCS